MTACIALLPAAGSGSRMGVAQPKQYLPLLGQPLIWHTLTALHAVPRLQRIVVVLSADDDDWDQFDWSGFTRLTVLRCGGDTRARSVRNGLNALAAAGQNPQDWVLVHDAARPCIAPELVDQLIDTLFDDAVGGILAVPVADTLKQASADQHIAATRPRDGLWQAQTPQMFRVGPLTGALDHVSEAHITDEASAMEQQGHAPRLVHGSPWNLKVTYPQDLHLASLILQQRKEAPHG